MIGICDSNKQTVVLWKILQGKKIGFEKKKRKIPNSSTMQPFIGVSVLLNFFGQYFSCKKFKTFFVIITSFISKIIELQNLFNGCVICSHGGFFVKRMKSTYFNFSYLWFHNISCTYNGIDAAWNKYFAEINFVWNGQKSKISVKTFSSSVYICHWHTQAWFQRP